MHAPDHLHLVVSVGGKRECVKEGRRGKAWVLDLDMRKSNGAEGACFLSGLCKACKSYFLTCASATDN